MNLKMLFRPDHSSVSRRRLRLLRQRCAPACFWLLARIAGHSGNAARQLQGRRLTERSQPSWLGQLRPAWARPHICPAPARHQRADPADQRERAVRRRRRQGTDGQRRHQHGLWAQDGHHREIDRHLHHQRRQPAERPDHRHDNQGRGQRQCHRHQDLGRRHRLDLRRPGRRRCPDRRQPGARNAHHPGRHRQRRAQPGDGYRQQQQVQADHGRDADGRGRSRQRLRPAGGDADRRGPRDRRLRPQRPAVRVGGQAYAAAANARVGSVIQNKIGKAALVSIGCDGTGGVTKTNNIEASMSARP